MRIDIDCLTDGSRGELVQGAWGDAKETACLMSALTGGTSIEQCAAEGWPEWLAELGTVVFDNAPKQQVLSRAIGFAEAVQAAEARGADWDEVFRAFRLDSVLPIALESIGDGDEAWRVECRHVVERSIERGGIKCDDDRAAEAARAAWAAWGEWVVGAAGATEAAAGAARAATAAWAAGAAEAAEAAWAAGAAEAAEAAGAAWAARAAEAAGAVEAAADAARAAAEAAWAAAHTQIYESICKVLRGEQ